jgi:hypothetical protein
VKKSRSFVVPGWHVIAKEARNLLVVAAKGGLGSQEYVIVLRTVVLSESLKIWECEKTAR